MSPVSLDPSLVSEDSLRLKESLDRRIIGQDRAVQQIIKVFEKFKSGINDPTKPLATLLLLGPTGVGKSEIIHVLADIIFGTRDAVTRVDCSEFSHSHEVSKLLGSPPGYVGHSEKSGVRLTQKKLDKWQREGSPKFNILLLDEVEKAHPEFFSLMLGVFDRGKLTLGDGDEVDLTQTLIVMTSNLGSRDTEKIVKQSGLGFQAESDREDIDQEIYEASKKAAKFFFRPEFINRIDRTIVFRSLSPASLQKILSLELTKVQKRILNSPIKFAFRISNPAKKFLLQEGTSDAYGARELKRAVEKHVSEPLASLMGSEQVTQQDCVIISYDGADELKFEKVTDPLAGYTR